MARPDIRLSNGLPDVILLEPQPIPLEREIRQVITKYEVPLLRGAWDRWSRQVLPNGKLRGWLMCDTTSITLSRILNWELDVPIAKDRDPYTQKHLRLKSYLHWPGDENADETSPHLVIEHFHGQGDVTLINVTGDLSFGSRKDLTGADDLQGAIQVDTYRLSDYDQALQNKHNLYPLNLSSPVARAMFARNRIPLPTEDPSPDISDVNNDDRITSEPPFIGNSGREARFGTYPDRFGPPLADFIREFIPGWSGIRRS